MVFLAFYTTQVYSFAYLCPLAFVKLFNYMDRLLRKISRWFLDGIFVFIPLAITLSIIAYPLNYVSDWVASFFDQIFGFFLTDIENKSTENALFTFLKRFINENHVQILQKIGKLPYSNLFAAAIALTFLGMLVSNVFIKSWVRFLEKLILRIPGFNLIYSYVKESTSAFIGRFNEPVIVMINPTYNIQKIGFITQKNIGKLGTSNKQVAVYLPHSYSFSGELFFFAEKDIKVLKMSSTEAWKLILSGGLAEVKPLSLRNKNNKLVNKKNITKRAR